MADRKYWATYFRGKTDEELLTFHADAAYHEQRSNNTLGRTTHRDRRLAVERELRKRGVEVPPL